MYIKITTNKTGQSYYHLVESYRDQGKVRQRTLLSLGKVGEGRLDDLVNALARHKDIVDTMELAKLVDVSDTYIFGPLLIVEHLFKRFGITTILDAIVNKHPRLAFNFQRIIFTLVSCRFLEPCSKLKIFDYWQNKFYPEMIAGKDDLQHIYRAIDLLAEHKDDVENTLFWHDRDLLNRKVDVILYDLTTLRFESTREDLGSLRRFGYSKEMRTDCTQVVLGLLVDTLGIPIGFEVYPGNTFEGNTLKDIVSRMREKFRIKRFIFVADRGLFSAANLNHIRAGCGVTSEEQGQFIVGMKLGQSKKRHAEFYDRKKFQSIGNNLELYETTHKGDRCIITWSKARAERDRKTREDILSKIKKKLTDKNTSNKTFVSNTNYRKFISGLKQGHPQLNEEAISEAAKSDGFFAVITNVPQEQMNALSIISAYKHLWVVEDAFGEIKGNLKARPVFHWTDKRILGHLTLCFLAYFCEAQVTKLLREKEITLTSRAIQNKTIKTRPLTTVEAIRELADVKAIPVKVRDTIIWVRTDIKDNAAKLFKVLGIPIPAKLLTSTSLAAST